MSYTSPSNIIKGMLAILNANIDDINELIHYYTSGNELHVFVGMRKTLPNSSFPSLELEPDGSSSDWYTTTAQDCSYDINCTLTVNCNDDELGAEYISQLTRKIVQIFNYPSNMSFIIPDEYQGLNKEPVWAQFGYISSVSYGAMKNGSIRQSQWTYSCKVLEIYDYWNLTNGPVRMEHKDDILPDD